MNRDAYGHDPNQQSDVTGLDPNEDCASDYDEPGEPATAPEPSEFDKHVIAICKELNAPIVLAWDPETGCFMVADYFDEQEKGSERPAPRIEYQLSDGLPQDRGYSEDCYSYEEAKRKWGPFTVLIAERRRRY